VATPGLHLDGWNKAYAVYPDDASKPFRSADANPRRPKAYCCDPKVTVSSGVGTPPKARLRRSGSRIGCRVIALALERLARKFVQAVSWAWIPTGLFAVTGLSGCGGDLKVQPPGMPTMGAIPTAPGFAARPDEALSRVTAAVECDDFHAAVRALATLTPTERAVVARTLVATLAQHDWAKAERLAQALPGVTLQPEAVEILARVIAARDPDAAMRWAVSTVSPSLALLARLSVADQLAARVPRLAAQRLLVLPPSPARAELLGYLAAAWARRDAPAALDWLSALAAGEDKDRSTTSIAFALAQSDPSRAVELLETFPEGRDRMVLIGAIGQTWVARDENAAWRWANRLPSEATRQAALAGIETGLGGAAARFARGEPPPTPSGTRIGPDRARSAVATPSALNREDAVRRGFDVALQESPVNAAIYLNSLSTPDRRDDLVDELVRRWLPLNPEATRAWVNQNVTNPLRREELLRAY
jgi:hypothetical protein